MKRELGIFIHPYSDPPAQRKARAINDALPSSFRTQEIADLSTARRILVVGGDGSLRRVMQFVYDEEALETQIGILGGGTNNVIHKELIRNGVTHSLEDFLDSDQGKDEHLLFRPGLFGNQVFTATVGVGQFENMAGSYLEKLRAYTPRRLRFKISSLFSLVSMMARENPNLLPLDLVSTSPNFGSVTLFPQQELHSSLLTHAWIEEKGFEGLRKLLVTLFCWQTGIKPPKSALKTEQATSFELSNPGSTLWADGDTFFRFLGENHGNMLVNRASQAFAVTAII